MLEKIIESVLGIGDSLGAFVIPVALAAVIILGLFARNSYKVFRIALPIIAGVAATFISASAIRDAIAGNSISEIINIEYVGGLLVGLIIAGICVKLHRLAMFLLGAGLGYVVVGDLIKDFLLGNDYITGLAVAFGSPVVSIVGIVISLICLVVVSFLFMKLFKVIYVLATSIGGMAAAAGIAAIFIFANTNIAILALTVALVLGAIIGFIAAIKQFKRVVVVVSDDE